MGRRFAELAFTPAIKAQQIKHGSRTIYERVEQSHDLGDRLGPHEQDFIGTRDSFYMASITESDWPYVQFRGGSPGFLHTIDPQTLGFADLRGNKQYISVGNLEQNDRVALFLMDYPGQRRLKILGHEKTTRAPKKGPSSSRSSAWPAKKRQQSAPS
jgi:predicted pyridoxine 5'-phosphate oxidase superfamily flavin-nucleotide-binding protein